MAITYLATRFCSQFGSRKENQLPDFIKLEGKQALNKGMCSFRDDRMLRENLSSRPIRAQKKESKVSS